MGFFTSFPHGSTSLSDYVDLNDQLPPSYQSFEAMDDSTVHPPICRTTQFHDEGKTTNEGVREGVEKRQEKTSFSMYDGHHLCPSRRMYPKTTWCANREIVSCGGLVIAVIHFKFFVLRRAISYIST
ncbi:hypothetical protein Adt_35513 [Abeliophyllum distichum]|uniref:Uncharacterized protein n=1 Tax=Abeliophyllum distichum TaxID=126358 RepID=A0ABD1QEY4_9LAMI